MVVCTLCSCYPHALLGLPPAWYKSFAYRSRAVLEPRAVLREFGVDLPESTSRSASGTRAPSCATWCCPSARPAPSGLSEDELAALVTRDAMIGVARGAASGRRGALIAMTPMDTVPSREIADMTGAAGAAAQERRAGLRRALGGPRLRHDRRDEPRGVLRVARVPGAADRRDRARGARGRVHELLRALARTPSSACSPTRAWSTPTALAERTRDFESGRRDDVF